MGNSSSFSASCSEDTPSSLSLSLSLSVSLCLKLRFPPHPLSPPSRYKKGLRPQPPTSCWIRPLSREQHGRRSSPIGSAILPGLVHLQHALLLSAAGHRSHHLLLQSTKCQRGGGLHHGFRRLADGQDAQHRGARVWNYFDHHFRRRQSHLMNSFHFFITEAAHIGCKLCRILLLPWRPHPLLPLMGLKRSRCVRLRADPQAIYI